MLGRWLLVALLVVIATARSMPAQSPPAFEVASVRPNPNPYIRPVLFTPPDSPILITNYTLGALVYYAYDLKGSHQMRGGPEWLMKDRFDIRGIPPSGSSESQIPAMLQRLLAERFKLRVRSDTSPQPVWTLVVDRADGRLGPKLTTSPHDCKAFFATGATISSPDNPRDADGRAVCGSGVVPSNVGRGIGVIIGGKPIADLAAFLEQWGQLDAPIVDRTGLSGNYTARVDFAVTSAPNTATIDAAPDIYTAVKEQLGLKLERRMEPRTTLVIESAERPTPD